MDPLYLLSGPFVQEDIFQTMLETEKMYSVMPYFGTIQAVITPRHRAILVEWLQELHTDYQFDDGVLETAVTVLDLFLSRCDTKVCHLQKVGAACFLIAVKVRDTKRIRINSLVRLSANCFSALELREQEYQVLEAVFWRVPSVVSCDFVVPLLLNLGLLGTYSPELSQEIRKNSETLLLSLPLSSARPSLKAAAAIFFTLTCSSPQPHLPADLLNSLASLIQSSALQLEQLVHQAYKST